MAEAVNIKQKITLYLQEAVTALQQEAIDKDEPIGRYVTYGILVGTVHCGLFIRVIFVMCWIL